MKATPAAEPLVATPALANPESTERTLAATSDASSDWLCGACYNPVAAESDRLSIEGKDEFTFSNPDGIKFDILTFARTRNCCEGGMPTLKYTWFPGHAWSYCLCGQCGGHLGWFYLGKCNFAGLIQGRIIRAIHLRN